MLQPDEIQYNSLKDLAVRISRFMPLTLNCIQIAVEVGRLDCEYRPLNLVYCDLL